MSKRIKVILGITLSLILVTLLLLAALTYIPQTRELRYEMNGFIITPDGEILEQFPFTMYGKEYDFIIDRPGGRISFVGNQLVRIEKDAFILDFDWKSATISKNYTFGHFTGDPHPDHPQYVFGTLDYYCGTTNRSHSEGGMLALEEGAFCMYVNDLAENAIVIGVSDPDTDPMALLETYLKYAHVPDLESASEN